MLTNPDRHIPRPQRGTLTQNPMQPDLNLKDKICFEAVTILLQQGVLTQNGGATRSDHQRSIFFNKEWE